MTVSELSGLPKLEPLCLGTGLDRPVLSVYSCDLLSFVMGRAPEGCAWITVMGNVNAIAVAVLADVACIVLAEGASIDEDALARAQQQGVTVLRTGLPVFEAGLAIHQQL